MVTTPLIGYPGHLDHLRALLRRKIAELDQRLQKMQALRALLSAYLAECTAALTNGRAQAGCPVLEDIAQHLSHQEKAQP